ncbi:antitoxin VbhA family protein [Leifsonia sp. 2MCAF36]|uniref:antitoxin VbhA family protein n=1 Tax=Leifsonia sp. 2MCAF36 TaxID=3232988 RepID=UPI003F9EA09C
MVADAAHSSDMESLTASAEYRADATAFVEGQFDADELGRRTRTRARYGLS